MISGIYGSGAIDSLGHSELDWEYAKRKSENPGITFEDVLKEKYESIEDADQEERVKR